MAGKAPRVDRAVARAYGAPPHRTDVDDDPPAELVRKFSRSKSWGTVLIDRLNKETRDRKDARRGRGDDGKRVHAPFFSKLGYIIHFGEPIADENIHMHDEEWVAKMLSRTHWWIIHPFSAFRRYVLYAGPHTTAFAW